VTTRIPPEGEDPVRVRADIRWRDATATVTIPEVLVYSPGMYFAVEYRTLHAPSPPPPERRKASEERRREAEESARRKRIWRPLANRITVNGVQGAVTYVENHERGFTAWIWSVSSANPDSRPANAARIQLNWPDFPGADATVPYPPPGSPTAPAPDIPEYWADSGNNFGVAGVRLGPASFDPVIAGKPPEERA
jgi:hypothetical protein